MSGYLFADCRFDLADAAAGRRAYEIGHIPGAVFFDLEVDLSDPSVPPEQGGRHPLPEASTFARRASELGVSAARTVVAYDQGMAGGSARLAWMLRVLGQADVALLDGGIASWWGPLRSGVEHAPPGSFAAVGWPPAAIASTDELRERLGDPRLTVLDARAPERYRGDVEPLDPVAGHIPGAVNAPFDAAALPEGVLERDEIVVYCGSGVSACVVLARLAAAGRPDARLYPGSWSEWSRRGLPVSRG